MPAFSEPGSAQVSLALTLGALSAPFYKRYIQGLPLRGDESVLDFGSGSGVCTRHLAKRLLKGGGRVTCVDISQVWMTTLQRSLGSYRNVDFRLGDIEQVSLPDHAYDAIFIHFVLNEVPPADRARVVKGLARKLKTGGVWFVREPVEKSAISQEEICALLLSAGYHEASAALRSSLLTGKVYEGVYKI